MKSVSALIAVSLMMVMPRISPAQENEVGITVGDVMSADELRQTGVLSLTPQQRAALDQWLQRYTLRVLAIAQGSGPSSGAYSGVGAGHWIKEVDSGGRLITLEDTSVWEVHSLYRIYTTLWLPITSISVLSSDSPIGDYKYLLVNTDDGESALAKYLGKG